MPSLCLATLRRTKASSRNVSKISCQERETLQVYAGMSPEKHLPCVYYFYRSIYYNSPISIPEQGQSHSVLEGRHQKSHELRSAWRSHLIIDCYNSYCIIASSLVYTESDLVDVMRKSFLKYILENWSDFLVNSFVLSLSWSKVSQLIASCHLKHNMTYMLIRIEVLNS